MSSDSEEAELAQLYQHTSDELRRLLVRKLGNREEAEEIAHDAYLKLCRIQHNTDIRDLRKYLFTMAFRLALNVLRKRKTERKYLDYQQLEVSDGAAGSHQSAYHILLAELKLNLVRDALEELPDKTRYIFLLHRFEGLTYSMISSKLAISGKTVEYHMARAMEKVMRSVAELEKMDE
jgi:RNA polymerase sigma factor (sigma-70 family)